MKNALGFLKNLRSLLYVLCEKPLGVFQRTFISKSVHCDQSVRGYPANELTDRHDGRLEFAAMHWKIRVSMDANSKIPWYPKLLF
jgi:hypothetical protein